MVLSILGLEITVSFSHTKTCAHLLKDRIGQRIDYVLCSSDIKTWFGGANIQEGLMVWLNASPCPNVLPRLTSAQGSDHCPVYGVINEKVMVDGCEKHILDIVNPPGLFIDGKRQLSQAVPQLKLSVRVSGEYAGRQSIRDMFLKASSRSTTTHALGNRSQNTDSFTGPRNTAAADNPSVADALKTPSFPATTVSSKTNSLSAISRPRASLQVLGPPAKRQKKAGSPVKKPPDTARLKSPSCGQQSLMGFLKKPLPAPEELRSPSAERSLDSSQRDSVSGVPEESLQVKDEILSQASNDTAYEEGSFPSVDPIVSKEEWSQLFARRAVPRCEAHSEPCIQRITRKPGVNVGRAFWMCSRLVLTRVLLLPTIISFFIGLTRVIIS